MKTNLNPLPPNLAALHRKHDSLKAANRYASQSRAGSTWRTYESAWRVFDGWCSDLGLSSLPATPETVAMFIANEADAGKALSTIEHRLAAIRLVHLGHGVASPHNTLAVVEVLRGIRRDRRHEKNNPNQKAPALDAVVKRLVDTIDTAKISGLRDRALILYGFAGALRRSEIVGINVQHISVRNQGHLLTIPYSKGDQEGSGQVVGILGQPESTYCPIKALRLWMQNGKIRSGPVFRRVYRNGRVGESRLGDRSVAEVIKQAVYQLKDPKLSYEDFSGHSLRRGFLTSAGKNQVDLLKLVAQSRHKRVDTVLGYIDDKDHFDQHAAESLLLSENQLVSAADSDDAGST